jgi:hypothetical protein
MRKYNDYNNNENKILLERQRKWIVIFQAQDLKLEYYQKFMNFILTFYLSFPNYILIFMCPFQKTLEVLYNDLQ